MPRKRNLDLWLIVLLAAALRLWALDLKAPHFDEGINGWFADKMRSEHTFQYGELTPWTYHGPWHFYALFVSQSLLGRNIWALRLPVVLASLLCIPAIFMFARWFGRGAVRWAALAFAVSPACVFYGRYSIHEAWFVLFCMLFTWGTLALWLDRDKAGLWATAAGITGMILTKETFVMHAGTLALAAGVFAVWGRISPLAPPLQRAGKRGWTARDVWKACAAMIFLIVFFYSGNFFSPESLGKFLNVFGDLADAGKTGKGHEKTAFDLLPFVNYYWLALLARYEWPALAGLIWSVRYARPGPAAPRLLAIYAGGILLAYSVIPYKTPWCIIAIIWPWFLFFGAAIDATKHAWARAIGVLVLAASLGMALRLNFRQYEDDTEPYVYVQTYRSLATLTGPLLRAAAKDPRFYQVPGAICTDHYPLPWVLGDFTHLAYHGKPDPDNGKPLPATFAGNDFVVVESEESPKVRALLGPGFEERRFKFRSGMEECTVFFSRRIIEQNWDLSP